MTLLAHLKVGARLALGFGIVLALMATLVGVAISRLSFIQSNLDRVVEVDTAKVRLVNEMRDLARYQAVTIRDVVMQEDFSVKKTEMKLLKDAGVAYRAAVGKVVALATDAPASDALAVVGRAYDKSKAAMDAALEKSIDEDHAAAGTLIREQVRPAQLELAQALDGLLRQLEQASKDSAEQAAQAYQGALRTMAAIAAAALLTGLTIAVLIQRSVTRPLRRAVEVAERVADGDLSQCIDGSARDEVGQLLAALARMNESLRGIVTTLKTSADNVSLGSREIAAGNLDLSGRTEQQASALQQTSASMEELGSTVRQNAASARQASALADDATAVAERGGTAVAEVVRTMHEINEASRRIADIVSVIDGIAFQTNILALNAAVEAARAGEQGRGFAVVAAEVRTLAQRSATAAREIKGLIGASVDRVEQGSALVDRAGGTIQDVVGAIRKVAGIVGEISHASAEQSAGVTQVGQAVAQMDQATQQNAALVEQSAAAAASLRQQAEALVQAVAVFRLEGTGNARG